MMRIVHEVNQLDFGGVEKIVKNIIKFDQKNQHAIVCYKDGKFREKLEEVGAKIYMAGDDDIDIEADIVHIHTGGAISNLGCHLYKDFPVIETIHSPVRSAMRSHMIKQRVGVSDAVSKLNDGAITVLNGLDFDGLTPTRDPKEIIEELGINPGVPVVGRLGRIGRDKGVEDFLLTCHHIQQNGIDITPVIIGGEARDCDGYKGILKLMAESLPVKNVVWVDNKTDIANYLQIMEVFLYPSPTEGFGLVFAEAMYCGATVVTYDTPVTRELYQGYCLLAEQNLDSLIKETEKALEAPTLDAFSGMCRDFVVSEYQAERMSQQYQDLYEKTLVKRVEEVLA